MAADLICCVCDEPKGLFRTLMTREHPVCDRCYIAWYEGAGTDRDSIRKSLGIDGVPVVQAPGNDGGKPLHDSAWLHACPKSTGEVLLPVWRACKNCGATVDGVAGTQEPKENDRG